MVASKVIETLTWNSYSWSDLICNYTKGIICSELLNITFASETSITDVLFSWYSCFFYASEVELLIHGYLENVSFIHFSFLNKFFASCSQMLFERWIENVTACIPKIEWCSIKTKPKRCPVRKCKQRNTINLSLTWYLSKNSKTKTKNITCGQYALNIILTTSHIRKRIWNTDNMNLLLNH